MAQVPFYKFRTIVAYRSAARMPKITPFISEEPANPDFTDQEMEMIGLAGMMDVTGFVQSYGFHFWERIFFTRIRAASRHPFFRILISVPT